MLTGGYIRPAAQGSTALLEVLGGAQNVAVCGQQSAETVCCFEESYSFHTLPVTF
jgi:hypothetical protein